MIDQLRGSGPKSLLGPALHGPPWETQQHHKKKELNKKTPSTPATVVAHKPSKLNNKVNNRDLA